MEVFKSNVALFTYFNQIRLLEVRFSCINRFPSIQNSFTPIHGILFNFNAVPLEMVPMRIYSIITHFAGWILFLSLPILFVASQSGGHDFWSILFSFYALLFFATYLFIFYLHTYFLIPQLYSKKKWFLYIISLLVLLLAVFALKPFDHLVSRMPNRSAGDFDNRPPPDKFDRQNRDFKKPPPERFNEPGRRPPFGKDSSFDPSRQPREPHGRGGHPGRFIDIVSLFLLFLILIFSLAMHFLTRLRFAEQRAIQADADKANAELSFLKAQINPHFLFNTLNNIYSLAASKSEHTAESIMKLSNIMRYVTDDVAEDFVPLENEVDFIHNYIDLQRLRLGKKTNVIFSVSGNFENKRIAPLVLVTFIENVFKYGISNHEKTDIIIELTADNREIIFCCQNKLFQNPRNAERAGIGISNTRQRLEHLYPGKYLLDINTDNEKYTVKLILQF